jgi:hypothetical protein
MRLLSADCCLLLVACVATKSFAVRRKESALGAYLSFNHAITRFAFSDHRGSDPTWLLGHSKVSEDEFLWGLSVIWSRNFGVKVKDDKVLL